MVRRMPQRMKKGMVGRKPQKPQKRNKGMVVVERKRKLQRRTSLTIKMWTEWVTFVGTKCGPRIAAVFDFSYRFGLRASEVLRFEERWYLPCSWYTLYLREVYASFAWSAFPVAARCAENMATVLKECAGTSMLRNALKLKRTDTFSSQEPVRKISICTTWPPSKLRNG